MSDIVEWLRNSNSDEWCSGQLLKAADEIQRLRTELKESRRLFVRDTDEYIKWTEEAKAEIEKLRRDVKTAIMGDSAELQDVKRENEKLREALSEAEGHLEYAYMITFRDRLRDAAIAARSALAAIRESGDE